MPCNGKVMFTGSIGLENEDAVFKALGTKIGNRAKRYPDGETGIRAKWIRWVFDLFEQHPQLILASGNRDSGSPQEQQGFPRFVMAEGVTSETLHFDTLGYAQEALLSFTKFKSFKKDGIIPKDVRFQVSLPTAAALVTNFIDMDYRSQIEPAIEQGLGRDVAAICAAIPAYELAFQWDVAHEVIAHDGGEVMHYDNILAESVNRVSRQISYIPEGVDVGIHLCYGDPGHKHVIEPKDFSTCVAFANGICARATRTVEWIHMPVPSNRDDDAYFEPLQGIRLNPETELYLGLVHHTDGVEGTNKRVSTAEKYVADFGIATECGFGRRPPETIPHLLEIHATVADRLS